MATTYSLREKQPTRNLAFTVARFRELGIILLLVLIIAGATAVQPRFFTAFNMRSILLWVPLITVVAMGQMMVIITKGIDVSVGSQQALAGIIVGMLFRDIIGFNIYLGALLALLIGATTGAINGFLIAKVRIPPVITTLGTLSAFRGLTFIVSQGRQIDTNYIPRALKSWSIEGPFQFTYVPWVIIIAAVVAILAHLFLRYTKLGRNIYAIGGNPDAASLRGIPVAITTFMVYTITGAMAGFSGVLYASRFGFVNPGETGLGFELTVIAAVVVGGTNVFGGAGNVLGVVLGCLLLGTVNVALSVLGIAATWQLAVYGFVILLAVMADGLIQRELRRASTGE
jgi:rhamnose transport system permease protein